MSNGLIRARVLYEIASDIMSKSVVQPFDQNDLVSRILKDNVPDAKINRLAPVDNRRSKSTADSNEFTGNLIDPVVNHSRNSKKNFYSRNMSSSEILLD